MNKTRPRWLTLALLPLFFSGGEAQALEVDWSGQFWSEFNFVQNYAMDASDQGSRQDATRAAAGGYYVSGAGNQAASFQSLFMRVRPKVIVNDNIYIKSEWWLGDPIFGIFGSGLPYTIDQRQYYSYQTRGFPITAQRVWGEFLSDIGTFQVGRQPLHYGLGVVWNSGDNVWSRYMSTGDSIRWVAKFGSFTFIPSVIINSSGNNISGTCTVVGATCTPGNSQGGVVDYSILLKYENPEDELEGGVNVIRRLGGSGQDSNGGMRTPPQSGATPYTGSMNFTMFDLYARKKYNRVSLAAEVPLVTGSLGGSSYQSFAIAGEADWKVSDSMKLDLKAGYAPGQNNESSGSIGTFRAFYFNPNYHVGMILFNYQLANFAGAQTQNNPNLPASSLSSPYDNPIVDAAYFALSAEYKPNDKWTFKPTVLYALAPTTASSSSGFFYNYRTKSMVANAGLDQGNSLGWEVDLGVTFQWDEYFKFNLDTGIFIPGSFYAFSNVPGSPNATSPVFAASARVGVAF